MRQPKKTFIIAPKKTVEQPVSCYEIITSWLDTEICFNISNFCYPTFHTHDYYEITVVFKGSILHDINGTCYEMHTGDCCLVRPNDRHCFRFPTDALDEHPGYLNVNFMCRKAFLEDTFRALGPDAFDLLDTAKHPAPLVFSIPHPLISRLERTCLRIQSPGVPQPSNVMICKGMFVELVGCLIQNRFSKNQDTPPAWLQDFIYALQNPANFTKQVHEMTEHIPYSYSYVQKQFKQYMHTSIIAYINSIKLSYARDLLIGTDMPVADIASSIGFESTSHFNHLFKSAHGISPASIRGK